MASESGHSQPPIFDSFNDPSVRLQLRKNVLLLIDKMLSMQKPNMRRVLVYFRLIYLHVNDLLSGCALQRLTEAKAIRKIYADDEIFNNRPIPRYYHATKQPHVLPILDSMRIKYSANVSSPGAWFATGITHFINIYRSTS